MKLRLSLLVKVTYHQAPHNKRQSPSISFKSLLTVKDVKRQSLIKELHYQLPHMKMWHIVTVVEDTLGLQKQKYCIEIDDEQ